MSRRRFVVPVAVASAIAAGGVAGAVLGVPGVSGAQDSSTTLPAPDYPGGPGGPGGPGFGFRMHDGGPEFGLRGGGVLDAAAKALGMTTDELQQQLRDGKSIADVAKDKNVDLDKVVDAVVTELLSKQPDESTLRDKVKQMLENAPPQGFQPFEKPDGVPHFEMRGGIGPDMHDGRGGEGLSAAADALGITPEELRNDLHDGKTIADIAKDKNVDVQKVIDAMVAEAKSRITDFVNNGAPKRPEPPTTPTTTD